MRPTGGAAARREVAGRMAEAAGAWLDMLDEEQRALAVGAPPSGGVTDAERRRWFYTPTDHGGLTLHQQRPAQQRATMRLVATGLSTPGYVTVATTIGLENVLDQVEGFRGRSGRERSRDPGLYYLRVFGEPGATGTWGWRFGGHHVSLNNLVVDGELVSTTPCFLGADPATSPLLGGGLNRPLGPTEDLARELVRSLPADLAARTVLLPTAPPDIVTANRTVVSDGDAVDATAGFSEADARAVAYTVRPRGVPGADLDAAQRGLLRRLLGAYLLRVPEEVSPLSRYDDDAELDAVHLAWAGPTEPGGPTYYRLQGPDLLVEYDNTQRGANHAHAVWRDPARDFGMDVLARHRAEHHAGTG